MLRSLLLGAAAGARSLTALAAVSDAARRGALPMDAAPPRWLANPVVSTALKLMAAAEIWGDKQAQAPDRTTPLGMAARVLGGGLAGAAVASRKYLVLGALLGAGAAVGAAYLTVAGRMAALERFGQTRTGVIEDALTVAATQAVPLRGRRH